MVARRVTLRFSTPGRSWDQGTLNARSSREGDHCRLSGHFRKAPSVRLFSASASRADCPERGGVPQTHAPPRGVREAYAALTGRPVRQMGQWREGKLLEIIQVLHPPRLLSPPSDVRPSEIRTCGLGAPPSLSLPL